MRKKILVFLLFFVSVVHAQDVDNDGIPNASDLDSDNDGIPDVCECRSLANCTPIPTSAGFPIDRWELSYYQGREGIAGSPFGAANGGGGTGTAVLRGTSFIGLNQNSVYYSSNGTGPSNRWTTAENPTHPIVPSGYVGTTWTSSSHYQISFRRQMVGAGSLTFGGNVGDILDDALQVFINGIRMYAYWPGGSAPNSRPGATNTGTVAFAAGDEVEIRFTNIGGIGGLAFTFTIPAVVCLDTDGDGIFDYLDLDSDNDGIPDVVEAGGTDTNGDAIADNFIDGNNNGLNDIYDVNASGTAIPNLDTDGDGVLNYLDLDADGDGILDVTEAGGTDANRDGQVDGTIDSDTDGFLDVVDGDVGNDGVAENTVNALSVTGADSNGDGRPNTYSGNNFDGDLYPNSLDIDSDNDGLVDNTEGQSTPNYIAPLGNDADSDGIDDNYDNDDSNFGGNGSGIVPNDQDGLDLPDYLDLDTDNDGESDLIEGHDTNGDGVINGSDTPNANTGLPGGTTDSDGDGLLDGFDNNTTNNDATNASLSPTSHPDADGGSAERDWREVNSLLPVEMLYFKVSLEGRNTGALNWTTISELNNAGFDIEHASPVRGGGLNFTKIGFIKGNGTTLHSNDYQYKALNLAPGTHYFRLRQVDLDGNYAYTSIKALDVLETVNTMVLYPNPASNQVLIESSVLLKGETTIEVFDVLGVCVMKKIVSDTQLIELDVTDLAASSYTIRVHAENSASILRLIVTD